MIIRILRRLGSAVSITLLVALGLALLIWYLGPLLPIGEAHPFDSAIARFIAIGVVLLLALTVLLIILIRRARRDAKLTEEIVETVDETDEEDEIVKAELVELKGKLKEAMAALRKSKLGRRHLYELPWYVMIGPPGAGKTTAIVNSGLQFPLADSMGKNAIGGVGGTRNCDWWFTNDAVMIDTAGRYTTQDSTEAEDNAGWLGFLNLLKKHRKRQPINGAIVAISLSDLALQDEITQKSHAAAIRRRLHELREKLGVRFPVYVIFTKSDMIAGFTEFYDSLGKEDREQVWGFTLPLPKKTKGELNPVAAFDDEFDLLLRQLNAQSLEKMQQETDHQRRSLIASFPAQFASVRATARGFLDEVFQDNRFEKRHLLRGVYFTSGTQEGTPIDRLMMGMARTFGIGRQAIGTGRGSGRSFFLTRLFSGVIFTEAGLVSADDKVERRYRWSKRISIAAALLAAIGIGALWTRSYLGNAELIADASESVAEYRTAAADIPPSPIEDSDLPGVVPALNTLRDMPGQPSPATPNPPRALTYGLYQGKVLGNQAALTYRAALNQHLLPRLLLRLEEQMQANMNNPDFLYEALKIYLMLGQQGPMNQDLVKEWMELDWSVSYAGPGREDLREDLRGHLDAMLSQPMDAIALNGPLVEQVQGILSEMPLAQRVYNGIINSPRAKELPEWRLTDIGGPAIARVIVRSSGKPLNEGIEGIFTYDGFNQVFLDEALGVAKRIQSESWVLGPRGESEQSETALLAMSRDVLDLYYNDFISRYDKMLGDIDIIPMESLSHAVEVTNVLSGPTSPLVNILKAVSEETRLTEDRSALGTDGLGDSAKEIGNLELQSSLSSRSQLFLNALQSNILPGNGPAPKKPGAYVEERFSWLHDLVAEPDGQASQLSQLMDRLTEVYQELNKLSFAGGAAPATTGEGSAILRFQEMANRMEGPIPRWSTQISSGSSGITADGTRSSINAKWQSQVLPFCQQALTNRYPFDSRASADVAIADFQRLFAPGGMIESFFNENLRDFVDTRARPWAWKPVNDADLGISPAVLVQFQHAAEIRDAFFAGGAAPSISFQITPEALDPKAQEVFLEIDGQTVEFRHSAAPRPSAITWPGSVGAARVTFQPILQGAGNSLGRDGPWAWFRLLNAAEIRRTNVSDRTRLIFNVGGRIAIFQLQSGSVLNPFNLGALAEFACPTSF
ncbi:type VI secretion protein IcmF [Pseudooceanicola nanhaiensis]|jgi:type VI secretion system protein ImpL|uniref:Type VI secretion protein IcmF n=1 Tax=Pseudooceanicola nanhaiensis TaxID=375761 RepID=A0A917T341_9RHOB|nr:type VI secretion system membrane subunit TssM [Pseudooceanicola nanhaiensis]GGM08513.1 type VI secretion protein IcmF [Pseudooceanicola nanhaiensis]